MSDHFYIATTPRSGSAWLANALTTGDTFAHHEILRRSGGLNPKWTGHIMEGAVGCDLALWPEVIDGPLVVVIRQALSCQRSLERVLGEPVLASTLAAESFRACMDLRERADLVVDYCDLFEVSTLQRIRIALGLPEEDPDRDQQLIGMNVQAKVWDPSYTASQWFREMMIKRISSPGVYQPK